MNYPLTPIETKNSFCGQNLILLCNFSWIKLIKFLGNLLPRRKIKKKVLKPVKNTIENLLPSKAQIIIAFKSFSKCCGFDICQRKENGNISVLWKLQTFGINRANEVQSLVNNSIAQLIRKLTIRTEVFWHVGLFYVWQLWFKMNSSDLYQTTVAQSSTCSNCKL